MAIVTSVDGFLRGGAELLVEWLEEALVRAGHEAEVVRIPIDGDPLRLPEQLAMFRMIDLTDQADLVICVRPPAHLVRHPRKVLWFIHHLRAFYDLWGTTFSFPVSPHLRAVRDLVRRVDDGALREAAQVFALSDTVADRLRRFNGIEAEVLHHPLTPDYRPDPSRLGDEIVLAGRVVSAKRPDLLIEALARTTAPVRLRILGEAPRHGYGEGLRALARELGVGSRVTFYEGWVDEAEKRRRIAGALAGAYVAYDEDSYGYATLEYAVAGKAVLGTTDSGGVQEFVRDGVEGLLAAPTPESVAAAMDRLHRDRRATAAMGRAAAARMVELEISWDRVVERLVG